MIDTLPEERTHIIKAAQNIVHIELPKRFPWIIVPMDIDIGVCPVDGSWAEKDKYKPEKMVRTL